MKLHSSEAGQCIRYSVGTDWQILGELELPSRADAQLIINAWLSAALTPLHLHRGFLDKILQSAEDATEHAMQAEAIMKVQHTHLLIYVPAGRPVNRQTWGFFRIEKVETVAENEPSRDLSIEFYLYLEAH